MIISTFIGEHEAKMDDKGRVVFPSPLKNVIPEEADMTFILHKDIHRRCLEMFTLEQWQVQTQAVMSKLDLLFDPDHAEFWSKYMEDSAIVEPDPKVGRISIPRRLQDAIGLSKDVIFAGKGYKIEVWDKDSYLSGKMSDEKYRALAKEMSHKR